MRLRGYMADYIEINRANWDERAPLHAASREYGVEAFINDGGHLSDVVRFDLPLLGDISGQRGIHLQCHIGTDTVSLARLGATMTGLDFSPSSIAQARQLSQKCGTAVDFVESDVYSAFDAVQPSSFDFVYTGIGALCWLPSVERWAHVVSSLLRPGGRLFIREGHPILWTLDETVCDALAVKYPYFEQEEPLVFDDGTTYVETDGRMHLTVTHEWNHGMGEIITALLARQMEITLFREHDSVPWEALPGQMAGPEHGEWRLAEGSRRLPLTYTLCAIRNGRALPV